MSERDLPAAHALSKDVGWPHRLEDWQSVLSVAEGIVAHSAGRLIGTAMWWAYEPKGTRIGMVLLDPAIQRSGIVRAFLLASRSRSTVITMIVKSTRAGRNRD